MLDCAYCGQPHAPAARDNAGQPVCATCAMALLRTCPDPLLLPSAAQALYWQPPAAPEPAAPAAGFAAFVRSRQEVRRG